MRYIKKFDSLIVESVREGLKEFCEMNLAYLLDDDYRVYITLPYSSFFGKSYIINFIKWRFDHKLSFSWEDIMDHFIPFLQRLSASYTVDDECFIDVPGNSQGNLGKTLVLSVGSLINDPNIVNSFTENEIGNIIIIVKDE